MLARDGTLTVFNPAGELAFIQDTNGNKLNAGYTNGELTSLTDSTGATISYMYNSQGRVSEQSDTAGQTTLYSYDPTGQLLTSIAGPAGVTTYTYVTGQGAPSQYAVATVTLPDGFEKSYQYNSQGQLIKQTLTDGADPVSYTYNLARSRKPTPTTYPPRHTTMIPNIWRHTRTPSATWSTMRTTPTAT